MIQKMQTHCVGRYLIDLPGDLDQRYPAGSDASDATFYFGHDADFKTVDVSVWAEGLDEKKFAASVTKRAHGIASETNYEKNAPMLMSQETWAPGEVLLRYYASPDIGSAVLHEVHVLVRGVHTVMRTKSFDGSHNSAEDRLRELLPTITPVEDSTRANGFCLGPVAIAVNADYEEATFRFGAGASARPVKLTLDLNTFRQPEDEPSLIDRGEANLAGLGVSPSVLKKGRVQLAGRQAEQWLGSFDVDGARQLGFYAESNGTMASKSEPKIHLELLAGGQAPDGRQVSSPYADADAIRLWDSVISTLRPLAGR